MDLFMDILGVLHALYPLNHARSEHVQLEVGCPLLVVTHRAHERSRVRLANWRIALGTLVFFTIVAIPAAYGVVLAMGNTGKLSRLL